MAHTVEQFEANAQLDRARNALGEALGQIQDLDHGKVDVEKIGGSLAGSVKAIFAIQSSGLLTENALTDINSAMNHLRNTLVLLQEVGVEDPALDKATGTVAKTLALLYPVSKVLEKINRKKEEKTHSPQPITKPPADDRRNNERAIINADIGIHSSANFFTGFSQDISYGGLFVATYDLQAIGTNININFTIPPTGPVLSLNGTVRWLREYNETTPDIEPGMGIQFEHLSPNDRRAINKFMDKNPPMFYDE